MGYVVPCGGRREGNWRERVRKERGGRRGRGGKEGGRRPQVNTRSPRVLDDGHGGTWSMRSAAPAFSRLGLSSSLPAQLPKERLPLISHRFLSPFLPSVTTHGCCGPKPDSPFRPKTFCVKSEEYGILSENLLSHALHRPVTSYPSTDSS